MESGPFFSIFFLLYFPLEPARKKFIMNRLTNFLFPLTLILLFAACAQKPMSDVDTPEYHFRAGMRAVDNGDYPAALKSFNRSVDLDRKFAPGYGGLGLTYAHLGNVSEAKSNIDKAAGRAKKDPDVYVLCARSWIVLRSVENRWFKRAENYLEKALKYDEEHEGALYYFGEAHLYMYNFTEAEGYFRRVVDRKGDYAGKADDKWELLQKIVRAMPGTQAGKKVAIQEKINRADLAVIFVEELKVGELFDRMPQQNTGFQTPAQMQAASQPAIPADAVGHWAEVWIKECVNLGIMEPFPDGKFYPEDVVTRSSYAMAVQRLLVAATRDVNLETRYFGESPSRFSDVPSSHPAYNAMALCTERGIMQADVMTGRFNPSGNMSGADALLVIRTLQTSLRMTF